MNVKRTSSDAETLRQGEVAARGRAWRLVVFGDQAFSAHALPEAGTVAVGRGADVEIVVDEPSVSRRHAELSVGEGAKVRDLGSSNGTFIGGRRLEPQQWTDVPAGEPLKFGSVVAMLQRYDGSQGFERPRLLLAHGYFETRLEEECARAASTGGRFGVVRARCSDVELLRGALVELLEPADVLASYGPEELETLILSAERAEDVARKLEVRLHDAGARVNAALYGRDGRTPEQLLEAAGADRRAVPLKTGSPEVVVHDAVMEQLHALARRVAQSPLSVILLGETGVGKEVFAEEIHKASARADKPLLRLNCATLSEALLESELFGHERGAFTGAVKTKVGLLESAAGGSVFLDEVGELPPGIQAKLLRVIEQREVQRLGELRPRPIDVRFIAATNRDLEAEVARGAFRQDLFFRLNGISLVIPPLRERVGEIEPLARAFIAQACKSMGRTHEPTLPLPVLELLRRYGWPGNIRELRNVIERAVVLCAGGTLRAEHFPLEKMSAPVLQPMAKPPLPPSAPHAAPRLPEPVTSPGEVGDSSGDPARQRILDALARTGGNQTEAAKLLGVSRKTLMAWMDNHRIARPRKGAS